LIERITDGQNTTVWRAIVSDSEIESPRGVPENVTPVIQKLNRGVPDNESQVGVKERIKKTNIKKELIINPVTAQLFIDAFGKFYGDKEQERWEILYNSIGPVRAREIMQWALKKDIHLANRASLLDSLETAATKWQDRPGKKVRAADSGDRSKYVNNPYAEYLA
jgi:hypothetical protein